MEPTRAEPGPPKATPEARAAERAGAPEWLAKSKQWPAVSERPLDSAHLGRAHRAEIRVNAEARAAYLSLVADTTFSDGTWLVEFLSDAKTRQAGPIFALERRAGAWIFWDLDAAGRVRGEGRLSFCSGCHAGAPAAPVFGLPPSELPQESNATPARSPK